MRDSDWSRQFLLRSDWLLLFGPILTTKVAEERGVSKSLVVKWNKNRNKIKAESERNKRRENSGGVKATRQRRKLIGDKVKNSEKYPLASARVIVDFK